MKTVINIDTFADSYKTALLFSIYEGLKAGESFQVVSGQNMASLKLQFLDASLQNLRLEQPEKGGYLNIHKMKDFEIGCCGMCGG